MTDGVPDRAFPPELEGRTRPPDGSTPPTPEFFAGVVEGSLDAVIAVDQDGRIRYANPATEAMFGYSLAELVGQRVEILLPAHFRRIHAQHVSRFAEESDSSRRMTARPEIQGRRKDGSTFPAAASITKASGPDGPLMTATVRDLTGDHALQDAQRSAQDRLLRSIERSGDCVSIHDEQSCYIYLNAAGESLLGRGVDEVQGQHATSFVELHRDQIAGDLGADETRTFHTHVVRPDGTRIPVEIRAVSLGDGTVLATTRDVSSWVEAERAVRQSEERLVRAQTIAHVGTLERDLRTEESSWSEETYRILGLEILPGPRRREEFMDLVHPDDRQAVLKSRVDALAARRPRYTDAFRIVRSDGSTRYIDRVAEIDFDETGEPFRVINTIQDITERALAEQAIRASEARLARA